MELYLFRHGIAEDAVGGRPDSSRALTDQGREKTAAVVKMARKAGTMPTLIGSSPYVRAMQTAEIAAREFGWRGEIAKFASLVPHGAPEAVWNDVRALRGEDAVLLAGHEPLMGHLAAYLLDAPGLRLDVKKSTMIRIDFASLGAAPRGVLRWMLVPKLTL